MKKTIKVIIISIVIVGLVAMYVFSGFRFSAPAPSPKEQSIDYQTSTNVDPTPLEGAGPASGFQGPTPGAIPSVNGPASDPDVNGPASQ